MTFDPHPYQAYAIGRIIDDANVGLFLDMGLGKTVITLTAIRALIYDYLDVRRVLVIAPKKVAEATWQAEARKWAHLRNLRVETVLGSALQRQCALAAVADVYVINRENVQWLCDYYFETPRDWPFDMVVVDESSSFKNPAAKRFKSLKRQLGRIARMVILTGTPAPNGIEDLWSQIYLLDRGERLERNITAYRTRYFDHNPWRHEYTPKPGAFEAVQAKIADICVSMKAEDYITLPERIVDDIPVALDDKARKAYARMEKEMLLEADGEEITALSAAALTGKLLQLCGGAVYDEAGAYHEIHDAKLEALGELIEQLHGEHALLFYGYRHEVPRILKALGMAGAEEDDEETGEATSSVTADAAPPSPKGKGLRVRQLDGAADAEAWNRGEVDILLAHPASCAYGLNLQAGGRHVIWFTLSWSLEQYQQANARLHRQGQEKPVIIHRLLVQGGVDEDVAKALEGKRDVQDALIEALKAKMEGL